MPRKTLFTVCLFIALAGGCIAVWLLPLWFAAPDTHGVGSAPIIRPEFPVAFEARNGMVVGITGRGAVRAGLDVLREGGSAADAALTTGLAQIALAGGSYVSYAGILALTYYEAATGKVYYLNAGYNTPQGETDPLSIPKQASGRTALVPGFMAGVEAAHKRFGKLAFARLFEPAVQLAANGIPIDEELDYFIQLRNKVLTRLPEARTVFTKDGRVFYTQGDHWRQPQLADTLRQVADKGAAHMYTGDWAQRFVEIVQREEGTISMDDLKNYQVIWEDPVRTTFRKYEVFAPGAVSSKGGVSLIEAMNLLELADLKARGPCATSPESLFWMIQVTACDNLSGISPTGLKDFNGRDLSPSERVTKATSRWIWEQMQAGRWTYATKPAVSNGPAAAHSDGVVAVDCWGNVAALTHTINTNMWGETGIFVDGVSVPDSAAFQQRLIRQVGPGRRLPDGMAPLVVLADGRPVLGSSATGGSLHVKTVQVLCNMLEFGMAPQEAADAPAVMLPDWDRAGKPIGRIGEQDFGSKVVDAVRKLGQPVTIVPRAEQALFRGYWIGIFRDPATDTLKAGMPRDASSTAAGY